ncbi:gibberellin-regulated protein 2-like, partial [Ananas comosus]|uniref:Gibberellin-regulated protein 2-like n=1 Tax=Ananas comosus TaxID=4615 RepID=A0A6P5EFT0_ANACO
HAHTSSRLLLILFLIDVLIGFSIIFIYFSLFSFADCPAKCAYRCSKSGRPKMCLRACNTCCQRCHCVPPGTSGNTEKCPCWAHMKTHGGRPKCP